MISAGEFRNGVTFEMDGQVMQVVEFQHVKPGKGAAFVRTKMKNVITGAVTETSFNPTAKFENAYGEKKDMEYSYNDEMCIRDSCRTTATWWSTCLTRRPGPFMTWTACGRMPRWWT